MPTSRAQKVAQALVYAGIDPSWHLRMAVQGHSWFHIAVPVDEATAAHLEAPLRPGIVEGALVWGFHVKAWAAVWAALMRVPPRGGVEAVAVVVNKAWEESEGRIFRRTVWVSDETAH
jgi:hypothetical protein